MADHLIPLSSELLDEVREISRDKNASLEDFVDLAVRERLERLWDEKLEAETQIFEKAHPELVEKYMGRYLAMREGKVVDVDQEFETLFLRIQARYGNTPTLIRLVTSHPKVELRGPSPHLEPA